MPKANDLTGQRFGRLLAIRATTARASGGAVMWLCLCDCGQYKKTSSDNLRSGGTKSCGCLQKKQVRIHLAQFKKLPKEAYILYPGKKNELARSRAYLTNSYIKSLLVDGRAFSFKDIPPELIKIKREELKIKRLLKERQKEK